MIEGMHLRGITIGLDVSEKDFTTWFSKPEFENSGPAGGIVKDCCITCTASSYRGGGATGSVVEMKIPLEFAMSLFLWNTHGYEFYDSKV
jgi:hypothetical protein